MPEYGSEAKKRIRNGPALSYRILIRDNGRLVPMPSVLKCSYLSSRTRTVLL